MIPKNKKKQIEYYQKQIKRFEGKTDLQAKKFVKAFKENINKLKQ